VCQKRRKTGHRSREADLPRAFEPRSGSAGADAAAYGVCERHRRRAIPEHIAEFHGAARREMPASFEGDSQNKHREGCPDPPAPIPESDHRQ